MFSGRLRMGVWVLAAMAALFFVAGCGDDDDDSGDDDGGADDDTGDDDTGDDDVDDDSPVLDFPADETINIPGLSGEARVAFDEYMIPYVFARNTEDAVKVMGYVQAAQRFFQMDFYRHFAQGRLTEIAGDVALGADLEQRVNFMANDGTSVFGKIEASLDPELKTLLENYAEGVNAWLNDRRAETQPVGWPEEYGFFALLPDAVPDWTLIDTISFARYQTWDLSNSLYNEIYLTEWADALPSDLFETMFTRAMATDTVILDGAKSGAKSAGKSGAPSAPQHVLPAGYQGARRVLESMRANAAFRPVSPNGEASNNWIISPSINGGIGFLANDPHLTLSYPSVFHLAYMDTKELGAGDMRTWGAMFAGAPIVAIGANENLAWGETVAGYDVLDVYAETLVLDGSDPVAVEYDGGEVDLIKSTQTFVLTGGGETTQDIYVVPHHGPILPDSIIGTTAMSFRWTGHEPSQEPLAFRQLAVATNVDEGFAAVENFQVGAQNFVLQDTNGDLGYFPNARVPERSWAATYKPWFVLPGDGSAEWEGDIADMPQVKNPAKGWLVTANNDINGTLQSGDPTDGDHYWYYERDIGYRAQRIEEMLTEQLGGDGATMDSMQATQFTVQDNYARDLITAALGILGADISDLSDDAQDMVAYWEDWDFQTLSGLAGSDPNGPAADDEAVRAAAVAAMGFAEFDIELRVATFGDEVTDAGQDYPYGWTESVVAILGLMTDGEDSEFWDDVSTVPVETRRDIVAKAVNGAVATIAGWDEFDGAPIADWLWGRKHHLMLGHVAFAAFGLPGFDLGPFAIPGSDNTPNVAGYDESNTDFETTAGPSLRIIHEFADGEITTHVHYPGGQLPVTGDPHQQDMLENWLAGDYYEMPHQVQPILDVTQYMMSFVSE